MPRIRAGNIEEHKELTRRQILDAAQELFSEHGYQDTSLGDIAAFVGIGRTTLYEYFKDKEDLLASLVDETLPEVFQEMATLLRPEDSYIDQLADLTVRLTEWVVTDPTLGLLLHREVPRLSDATQQRIGVAHQDLSKEYARIYRGGVMSGEMRSMPWDLAGRFVQDLVMSASKVLIDSEDPQERMREVCDAMVGFLKNGISA
ncbi:MAG: TetR/AcrR family transcriptional regulator [Acidimicrobiia bacterium]|nr:TetR/AcrR family transcriptional regulator [Acidimicrobiia bacterium]